MSGLHRTLQWLLLIGFCVSDFNHYVRGASVYQVKGQALQELMPTNGGKPNKAKLLSTRPLAGEGAWGLLRRYGLLEAPCNIDAFYEINSLPRHAPLLRHRSYKLPIYIYRYNGKSIRSTLGISDWNLAVKIRDYNLRMMKEGLKKGDFRKTKVLWVPHSYLHCTKKSPKKTVLRIPLFGKNYEQVEILSNKLKGQVYYIVSGHGGPDPGAMVKNVEGKYHISEDEYAYDVALRLARKLIQHGALVHVIVQDPNDGIRDDMWLRMDKDETCMGKRIPRNQRRRLKQRTDIINHLYRQHKRRGIHHHKVIAIHVDSRSVNKNQDVFFYYYGPSKTGKQMAYNLYHTFKRKYEIHQKGRGYHGYVIDRPLYLLKNTLPPAVYVELANIRNPRDRVRLVKPSNREALAQWLFEGLIK